MPVTASSLLAPVGEIELEFFPGEDEEQVTERLDAYIEEGTAKASMLSGAGLDEAVMAWSYHRAYKTIYTRALAAPSTVGIDGEGSWSYQIAQIRLFSDLAAERLAEFNGLIAETPVAAPPPLASGSTGHVFTW